MRTRIILMILIFFLFCSSSINLLAEYYFLSDTFFNEKEYYLNAYLKIFKNLTKQEVLTIMKVESNGNVNTITYEPLVNDFSYGPLQVRLKTARSLGFTGDPVLLCTWKYGLYYGMKFLSYKKEEAMKKANTSYLQRTHMWAAYNAGQPRMIYRHDRWIYLNQSYVNKCEFVYNKLKRGDYCAMD